MWQDTGTGRQQKYEDMATHSSFKFNYVPAKFRLRENPDQQPIELVSYEELKEDAQHIH